VSRRERLNSRSGKCGTVKNAGVEIARVEKGGKIAAGRANGLFGGRVQKGH